MGSVFRRTQIHRAVRIGLQVRVVIAHDNRTFGMGRIRKRPPLVDEAVTRRCAFLANDATAFIEIPGIEFAVVVRLALFAYENAVFVR